MPKDETTLDVTLPKKVRMMCNHLINHEAGIRKALEHSSFGLTYDRLCARAIAGRYHLYPLKNSLVVMEVHEGEGFKHYAGVLATGDLEEIAKSHKMIEHQARRLGCTKFTMDGRRGWMRVFKKYGWKEQTTIIEKSLED